MMDCLPLIPGDKDGSADAAPSSTGASRERLAAHLNDAIRQGLGSTAERLLCEILIPEQQGYLFWLQMEAAKPKAREVLRCFLLSHCDADTSVLAWRTYWKIRKWSLMDQVAHLLPSAVLAARFQKLPEDIRLHLPKAAAICAAHALDCTLPPPDLGGRSRRM